MKALKKALILLVVAVGFIKAEAQIPLSIAPDTIQSSVDLGDTISFSAVIRNTDTSNTFIGRLSFNYTINDSLYTVPDDSSGIEFDTSSTIIILGPGDSILRYLKVNISSPKFSTGPSVVVIWPKTNFGSATYASDSIVLILTVSDPVGTADMKESPIRLYVLDNALWLKREEEILLKRVRILNAIGQEILIMPNPSDKIPLPETNKGMYLAEFTYNNNQRKIFRFYQ